MSYNLMIVESPVKARTISQYLSSEKESWKVLATGGHMFDLPEKDLCIDKDNGEYKGEYQLTESSKKYFLAIKKASKEAKKVYIGTDYDREGEVIAKHIVEFVGLKDYHRIIFTDVSKDSILAAIENPSLINKEIADAGITRRILDRGIGYEISPIMKYDFKQRGMEEEPAGIGRAQAPALHILVELEDEINDFESEPYSKIAVEYGDGKIPFTGHMGVDFFKEHQEQKISILSVLSNNPHVVVSYEPKTKDEAPKKPLISSSLQYGAWYILGFREKKTMKLAQGLKDKGWITYHRTDSYFISDDAAYAIIRIVDVLYGSEYALGTKRKYKNKKGAQEAHEAIRPTQLTLEGTPESLKDRGVIKNKNERFGELTTMTPDEFLLYQFIWYRTISTQMKSAIYDVSYAIIESGGERLKAEAKKLEFDGWLKVRGYIMRESEKDSEDFKYRAKDVELPRLMIGQELQVKRVYPTEHETKAPNRFGVGRFIQYAFNLGIARPSTLETLLPTLEEKGYIVIRAGILYPEALGRVVDKWIEEVIPFLHDLDHAKEFEEELQMIEEGEIRDINAFMREYFEVIDEVAESVGYNKAVEIAPSAYQLSQIEQIVQAKGVRPGESIFKDKKKAQVFILNHGVEDGGLGKCPACRRGVVLEQEKLFGCSRWDNGCKFAIWKNGISAFFQRFEKEFEPELVTKMIKGALDDNPIVLTNLKKKKGGTFDAGIIINRDSKFGWQIGFKFGLQRTNDTLVDANLKTDQELKIEQLTRELEKRKEEGQKDKLSRLYNREALENDLDIFIEEKTEGMFMAFVDADHFKKVNDTYGHHEGDLAIQYIADKMYASIREHGMRARPYRYGGEEFLILGVNTTREDFQALLESLRVSIQAGEISSEEHTFSITVSIGATTYIQGEAAGTFVKRADEGVYAAKEQGRNRIIFKEKEEEAIDAI